MVGTLNSVEFDGYDPGRVLLLGCNANKPEHGGTLWEFEYKFAIYDYDVAWPFIYVVNKWVNIKLSESYHHTDLNRFVA